MDERSEENLLRELKRNVAIFAFSAGKDADVADDQCLAGVGLDELLLARDLTADRGHGSVAGELTVR